MDLCFYSTYEELKLNSLTVISFPPFVFTVPMRNWNKFRYADLDTDTDGFYSTYEELKQGDSNHPLLFQSGFLQYLWGIETG